MGPLAAAGQPGTCYWCELPARACGCAGQVADHCPLCGRAMLRFLDTGAGSCTSCRMVDEDLVLRVRPRRFIAGYQVGWRMWHTDPQLMAPGMRRQIRHRTTDEVMPSGMHVLHSLNGAPWYPYERVEAVCPGGGLPPCPEEDAGDTQCGTCGIYAARTHGQLAAFAVQRSTVVGRVALWGRLDESELVWRAQYAYPLCFVASSTSPAGTAQLAEGWGVPLVGLLDALDMHEAEAAA